MYFFFSSLRGQQIPLNCWPLLCFLASGNAHMFCVCTRCSARTPPPLVCWDFAHERGVLTFCLFC
jgi:hypothetical protein